MPTINLKTYYDFTGAAVTPSAFTLQTLPTCAAGFSVKNVLWDTATNMIVTTTTPTTIGAVQILDDCTGAFSIVEGNKSAIEQYLSNECCVKLIAAASFINDINAPIGSPTCTDGSFEYPIIADMTPYGGSATQAVTSDEDLITILNGLTGVDVLVNCCQWYFPADYTGTISDVEVLVFNPPTILPTNDDTTETEIEYTATTGDIDGTPCVVTDITFSLSIDGGTTSIPPISLGTALAGTIDLCGFAISSLVGSANFTGMLTTTFEITTSCGVDTQTLDVPIITDASGLIKVVDGNVCFPPAVTLQAFDENADSPLNSVDNNDVITTITRGDGNPVSATDCAEWTFANGVTTCSSGDIVLDSGTFPADFATAMATCLGTMGLTKPSGLPLDASNFVLNGSTVSFVGMAKNLPLNGTNSAIAGTTWHGHGIPSKANGLNNEIQVSVVFKQGCATSPLLQVTDNDVIEQGKFLEWMFGNATNGSSAGLRHGFVAWSNVAPTPNNSYIVTALMDSVPYIVPYLSNSLGAIGKSEAYYFNPNQYPITDYCMEYSVAYTLPYSGQSVVGINRIAHELTAGQTPANMGLLRTFIIEQGYADDPYRIYLNAVGDTTTFPTTLIDIDLKLNGASILTNPNLTTPYNTGTAIFTDQNLCQLAKDVVHTISLEGQFTDVDGNVGTNCPAYSEIKFVITNR